MLFQFYFNKSFKEQKRAIFVLPIATVVVVVLSVAGVIYLPGILTSFTVHVVQSSQELIGNDKEGSLLVAALVGNGPLFAAMFCGMIGANIAAGVMDVEIRSGALETILSRNYTFEQVLQTILLVSLALGAITTIVLVAFISIIISCGILYYDMDFGLIFPFHIFIVPFVCLFCGLATGFMLHTILSRMAKVRATSVANIGQVASILPVILLILLYLLPLNISMAEKISYFSSFLIVLSVIMIFVALKYVNLSKILER